MSNYRDDIQETVAARASAWGGVVQMVGESARIGAALLFGLMVRHGDALAVQDAWSDSALHAVVEQAAVTDEAFGQLAAAVRVGERAVVAEHWAESLYALHEEAVVARDAVIDLSLGLTVETARIGDTVGGQRYANDLLADTLRARDFAGQFADETVTDTLSVQDWTGGRLGARVFIAEGAQISGEWTGSRLSGAPELVESAVARSGVFGHLAAFDLVSDGAMAGDSILGTDPDSGQAWTANVDNWAMSRYAPYTFPGGLAVIDGVLYGVAEDGVYALDGGQGSVAGRIVTGKLDLSGGALATPLYAYMEYELDGAVTMDVTTTQGGASITYSYSLPEKQDEEMVSGRIAFGRGLRGRHFAFTLHMEGGYCRINDLSVLVAPLKRRI